MPANISTSNDSLITSSDISTTIAATTAFTSPIITNSAFTASPVFTNSTVSDEPKTDVAEDGADGGSNIAIMLREENPMIAFDAQFRLFYITDNGEIYLSRFDIDPTKDTGGTLRVTMKFRQYDHVSFVFC